MSQTYAFIDGQNLHMSIRDQGWTLDYHAFRQYLADYRKYTQDIMGLNKLRKKLGVKRKGEA